MLSNRGFFFFELILGGVFGLMSRNETAKEQWGSEVQIGGTGAGRKSD
jgi:hypothetical protein